MIWSNKGHEFDEIGGMLKDKKHIYIYGAGDNSAELIYLISNLRKWIDWEIHLVDRDEDKQKTGWKRYPVTAPDLFFKEKKEDYFVVICAQPKAEEEIFKGLITNGIQEELIYKGFYFLYTYLPIYFAYVHDKVFFVSQNLLPTTVCNLNCRDCLNFTPYIEKHVTDNITDLKNDIDLFFNAVDMVYRFQITGGEPLLYKNVEQLLDYIYSNYSDKYIRLEMVTNGTIVPSDDFCQFLHDKNIYVFLDDYRLAIPDSEEIYELICDKFNKFQVEFCENYADRWIRMYPTKIEKTDYATFFNCCDNPWSTLRQGKISACNYGMYAAKAGICEDSIDEYYDLSKFTSEKKKELVEFRLRYNEKGYINFCKVCGGWTSINKTLSYPAIQIERKAYEME